MMKKPNVNNLISEAEALKNCHLFVLNHEQWETFQAALNAPPKDKPQLRRLLTEPSIFEQ